MTTTPTTPTDAQAPVDLLITHAMVATVDAHDTVLHDHAVAVAGGIIREVGPSAELEARHPAAPRLDATGQLLTPGFVNLHVHSALAVTRGLGDDLGGAPVYRRDVPQGVLLSPTDTATLSLLGGLQALAMGSTTLVENYLHARSNIEALATTGGRVVVSERVHDADLFTVREATYRFDEADGRRRLDDNVALIEEWHGAYDGRVTAMVGPHGPDTVSAPLLERCLEVAEAYDVGVFIHLAQTAGEGAHVAARTGLGSVQLLRKLGLLGPRLLAGHCAFIDEADAEALLESGTAICSLPTVNAKNGWMAPLNPLRRAGAVVGLGTDHMVHDMVTAMRMAVCVNRITDGGPGAISAAEALRMATIEGARALGRADEIGSVEVGKRADLLLVETRGLHMTPLLDPVANLVYAGQSADVRTVLVDGQVVVRDGAPQLVDAEAARVEAQRLTQHLWERTAGWVAPAGFRC